MNKRLLSLMMGLVFVALHAIGQEMTITGRVTSANDGLALPGVSVKVQGTPSSTVTGANGEFKIRASSGQTLVFSFIGFADKEVAVGNSNTIDVKLGEDTKTLNEVVVVGYGTQKKGNLTGAVSTIDVKKTLEGRPIVDIGRAIQGAAAGLSVVLPDGEVGSDPIIKVRGQVGSIQGSTSTSNSAKPLILLDNVEIPNITLVNPTDVASITILKDAAAASIYGSKAAFGVVLITTKKGSGTSKPQISYTNNFSFGNVWKDLKVGGLNAMKYTVDAAERAGLVQTGTFWNVDRASYLKAVEWEAKYGGIVGPNDPVVYGRDWESRTGGNKFGFRLYDPYEAFVREWAPSQTHNLSVGGTSGKTTYNIGLASLDESGMMKTAKKDRADRYNASLRLTSEINKYFTARAGAIYSRQNKEYPYVHQLTVSDPWQYLYRWSPTFPLGFDQNGQPIRSPAAEVAQANTSNRLRNYMNINLGGTVNIQKNWKVDFDYTYANRDNTTNLRGTRYTAADAWAVAKLRLDANGAQVYVNDQGDVVASNAPGARPAYELPVSEYTAFGTGIDRMSREAFNSYSHTINAFTTYNLDLKEKHNFKFILGLNRISENASSQFLEQTGLNDIINPQFDLSVGPVTGNGDASWEAQLGYFGRMNYAYKNKYLLEANLRYDGTSKFPTHLQWRYYPSFSAGWIASEESFMKWANPALSSLKFRGSWGSIGDQLVPNNLYISDMDGGPINWIGGNGAKVNYVGTPKAVSSVIEWQDIVTTNFGVDAGFLDNRLGVTFDIYQRNTDNMIVPKEGIPVTFGTSAPQSNYGSIETRGWELSIDFNHRFKNGLGINLRGNISDAKTTIAQYGTTKSINGYYNGKVWGEIWGYQTDRLYQMDDFELDASGKLQIVDLTPAMSAKYGKTDATAPKVYKLKNGPNGEKPVYQPLFQSGNFRFGPGDVKFVDVNGDGEINNGSSATDDHGDQEIIGNSTPRYEYGFRLGTDFKGFDFSAFFQGVGSRKIWGAGNLAIPGFNSGDGAMSSAIADDYWTPENTDAFYPAAYNLAGGSGANMQVQSRYLLNMSYLRLKNISLGYTIPQSLLRRVHVSSLRVYTSLENFKTWDKLGGLPIPPEAITGFSIFNESNYNLSRTGVGTPTYKSVSFGVQLTF